jgi:hypothetical protein
MEHWLTEFGEMLSSLTAMRRKYETCAAPGSSLIPGRSPEGRPVLRSYTPTEIYEAIAHCLRTPRHSLEGTVRALGYPNTSRLSRWCVRFGQILTTAHAGWTGMHMLTSRLEEFERTVK